MPTQITLQITNSALFRAAQVCTAPNTDRRHELKGVYISPEGDVVGTDGHRLFLADTIAHPVAPTDFPEKGIICRLDALVPVSKASPEGTPTPMSTLTLDLTGDDDNAGQGVYTPPKGKKILAEVIDGQYPDYKHALPSTRPAPGTTSISYIGLNPAYLADVAKTLKATGLSIRPHSIKENVPDGPLEITFLERDVPSALYRYIVMPMKV